MNNIQFTCNVRSFDDPLKIINDTFRKIENNVLIGIVKEIHTNQDTLDFVVHYIKEYNENDITCFMEDNYFWAAKIIINNDLPTGKMTICGDTIIDDESEGEYGFGGNWWK